jgi:hypothetical protein
MANAEVHSSSMVPEVKEQPQTKKAPNELEQYIAEVASTLGSSEDRGQSVKDMAKSYVEQKGEKAAHKALSAFGSAEVGIELDERFRLSSGHVELLTPFGGDKDSTYFTQGGVVLNRDGHYSGRDFAHLGFGYRFKKHDELMYGVNAFYDYDLRRSHQRGSFGGELWYQNYKLSGNYYFPLSGWKESSEQIVGRELYDLTERAARGIDFKAEGYLPNLPSISADIGMGMMFGDLVEVSDGSEPVSNPYAFDTNVHYQPIPLVRLSAGYSYEKRSGGEGTLGASLTYNFGQPLSEQINPSNSGQTKELSHQMKTAMVSRNNNIVLKYKEKEQPFAFILKMNHMEVPSGTVISARSLVDVSSIANVAYFEMVVNGGSASMAKAHSNKDKLEGDRIEKLQYAFPSASSNTDYSIVFVAHLKNNRPPIQSHPVSVTVLSEALVKAPAATLTPNTGLITVTGKDIQWKGKSLGPVRSVKPAGTAPGQMYVRRYITHKSQNRVARFQETLIMDTQFALDQIFGLIMNSPNQIRFATHARDVRYATNGSKQAMKWVSSWPSKTMSTRTLYMYQAYSPTLVPTTQSSYQTPAIPVVVTLTDGTTVVGQVAAGHAKSPYYDR